MGLTVVAPLVIFAISFVFPMLGMGGSQVYVPALLWMGMDLKTEAIPLALLLNLVSSSSATLTYGRRQLIEWRTAAFFALAAFLLAPLGARVNVELSPKTLISVFAAFTALASIVMLSGWRPKRKVSSEQGKLALGLGGGGALGFVCGLIGRGGGSLAVPILYQAGLNAKNAAATSIFIVAWSSLASFLSHIRLAARPNWSIWAPCVIAVVIGSQCGSRLMVEKLNARGVRLLFGIALAGVAAAMIIHDVIMAK
ncbi:MAG: sulfite exporter TauE/SafE family protein [Candidatus Coatesbacteria bacterium]|nr:sulfite exporter TauE/SafE family protein [Candidatus Coatesbacteria bacterium]